MDFPYGFSPIPAISPDRNPPERPSVTVFVDFPYGFSPISAISPDGNPPERPSVTVFVDFPYGFSPIPAISPDRNPPELPSVTVFMDFHLVLSSMSKYWKLPRVSYDVDTEWQTCRIAWTSISLGTGYPWVFEDRGIVCQGLWMTEITRL